MTLSSSTHYTIICKTDILTLCSTPSLQEAGNGVRDRYRAVIRVGIRGRDGIRSYIDGPKDKGWMRDSKLDVRGVCCTLFSYKIH